jgi:hypothetical protein
MIANTDIMGEAFAFDPGSMKRRVFVVGCSRSGTTLLQSLLAAHPNVATFPETNFFWKVLVHAPRRKYLVDMGLATGREMKHLRGMLERFGRDDLAASVPDQPWTFQAAIDAYLSVLDHLAEQQEGTCWVEKTPLHIRYIDTIEQYVPSPLFVHTVRDGREVVASIEDRARKHPESFGGQGVEYGVQLWNECVEHTKSHRRKENHRIVRYENLVEDTDTVMEDLCRFIGLHYEPEMKENRVANPDQYILPSEEWKEKVTRPIQKTPSKFHRLFGAERRNQIEQALDLDSLDTVAPLRHVGSAPTTEVSR